MRLGTPSFSGKRLRQARMARGLSEIDLASKLGISRQRVSQYELGEHTPNEALVEDLSAILALPNGYFISTPHETAEPRTLWFRSLESTARRARESAQVRLAWLVEIVRELERHVSLPPVELPDIHAGSPETLNDDDIELLASEYREVLGFGGEPIDDLMTQLERRGIVVSRFDLLARQLDAFSCWTDDGRPYIVLDQGRSAVRQRLDLAHEVGHLILHRDIIDAPGEHGRNETQAFRFGAGLLFPRDAFLREILPTATLSSLLIPKRRWKVSMKMMINRAHELGVISRERMQQLFKQYSAAGYRRSGEPLDSTLPVEQPTMLRRAFDVIVSSPTATVSLRSLFLSDVEVEVLCALPQGHLAGWLFPVPRARPRQSSLF